MLLVTWDPVPVAWWKQCLRHRRQSSCFKWPDRYVSVISAGATPFLHYPVTMTKICLKHARKMVKSLIHEYQIWCWTTLTIHNKCKYVGNHRKIPMLWISQGKPFLPSDLKPWFHRPQCAEIGTARLSFMGSCPQISTGGYGFHGPIWSTSSVSRNGTACSCDQRDRTHYRRTWFNLVHYRARYIERDQAIWGTIVLWEGRVAHHWLKSAVPRLYASSDTLCFALVNFCQKYKFAINAAISIRRHDLAWISHIR